MPILAQGAVVLVQVADPRGQNPKIRPAIVTSSNEDIQERRPLSLVAITSNVVEPLPENQLELPWDLAGKARSGLKKRSAAVCDWLVTVEQDHIERIIGHLPATLMVEVIRRLPPESQ
jgi:mRNA-degrading endonuclease toxin of MazEF toxin-antitoxin module